MTKLSAIHHLLLHWPEQRPNNPDRCAKRRKSEGQNPHGSLGHTFFLHPHGDTKAKGEEKQVSAPPARGRSPPTGVTELCAHSWPRCCPSILPNPGSLPPFQARGAGTEAQTLGSTRSLPVTSPGRVDNLSPARSSPAQPPRRAETSDSSPGTRLHPGNLALGYRPLYGLQTALAGPLTAKHSPTL